MPTPAAPPPALTGPQQAARYRAVGNPTRRGALRLLARHGAASTTSLARELGVSGRAMGYHLRKLADAQLVEQVVGRSTGRQRWWRARESEDRQAQPPAAPRTDPAGGADPAWVSEDAEILIRSYARPDGPDGPDGPDRPDGVTGSEGTDGWVRSARHGALMTQQELRQFFDEFRALLWRYGHTPADQPPGARAVALRFVAVPVDAPTPVGRVPG